MSNDVYVTRRSRLRKLIDIKFNGVTSHCAEALGMKPPQLHRWLSDKGQNMHENSAREIERVLGLEREWMDAIDGAKADTELQPGPIIRRVPVISWTNAATEERLVSIEGWAATDYPISEKAFALRITGKAMEPEFPDGCLIVVDPSIDAAPGHYVVAGWPGKDLMFRRYVKDGPDAWLMPLNAQYPTKPFDGHVIIGVVVQQIKTYL